MQCQRQVKAVVNGPLMLESQIEGVVYERHGRVQGRRILRDFYVSLERLRSADRSTGSSFPQDICDFC